MEINKAVDLLDNLIGMVDDNQGNDYDAAFHMAIDALKAQEVANNSPKLDSDSGELISKQDAINGKISVQRTNGVEIYSDDVVPVKYLENLPSAQPEKTQLSEEDATSDCISRHAVRNKLIALVNEFEEILSNIREKEVDDSVCGLCEYDGAYIGQSGDWCNECPGFEKDDCFKLKEKYREEWMKIDG